MCFSKTYSNIHTGKNLLDAFPIQNGLKQDALLPLLFNFASEYAIRKIQENKEDFILSSTRPGGPFHIFLPSPH
jgi:hypothetical protein